jgi:hypothetical protein
MKKNKIILLVILVLAVVAVLLVANNRYSTLENGESDFAVSDTSSITKIFIADKNVNSITLDRTESGWKLDGKFPANQRNVEVILETLKRFKVKAPVSLASHDNVVKRMATVGKKVEVYQMVYRINLFDKIKLFRHEKLTKVFYVGDATQDNLGTYMLMEGANQPYIVYLPSFRGFLNTRFSPNPDDWKSHIIFNKTLANIKSISVEFGRQAEESFRVDVIDSKGNYDLTALAGMEKVDSYDTLRLLNFLTSFRDLRYESRLNNLLPPVKIDSIVNSPFLYEIVLVDQKNDTSMVKIFEKKEVGWEEKGLLLEQIPVDYDRIYGLVNDDEDFVLLQYYVFDKVLYPLSYYKR